jgi:membrane-associated phospholipid phosphatase
LRKKPGAPYNPFFLIPFIVWVIVGGLLLLLFSNKDLFLAINTHYNDTADAFFYYATWMGEGWVIVIVLAGLLLIPRYRNWWYFLTASLCNLIPFFIQQILKVMFNSPRPFKYFHNAPWIHYLYKWPYLSDRSFPSGHSEGAFSFFCFLSLLLPAKYRVIGVIFFLLALSVCYSRIYLAAHFFADVYAGSILGAVTTSLIFVVMNKYKESFFTKRNTV